MWSSILSPFPPPSGLTPVVWSRWQTLVSLRTSTPRTTSDRGKRMLRCDCPSGGWHLRVYKMASSLRKQTWWVKVGRQFGWLSFHCFLSNTLVTRPSLLQFLILQVIKNWRNRRPDSLPLFHSLPPTISGHLVWHAGRYSVWVECPTPEWTPSLSSSFWRQGSDWRNHPTQHVQMRCEHWLQYYPPPPASPPSPPPPPPPPPPDCTTILLLLLLLLLHFLLLLLLQLLHCLALLVWECWQETAILWVSDRHNNLSGGHCRLHGL